MPGDSTDTKNRLYASAERARRELLKDIEMTPDFPGGVIAVNVDVFSSTFQEVFPELLAYSQRRRAEELTQAVGQLSKVSSDILGASDRLYTITKALLAVACVTLAVAAVSLATVLAGR